jgi:hypothetical protein
MFSKGSRYEKIAQAAYTDRGGKQIAYILLRPIPSPAKLREHAVVQGDRLDLLSFQYYNDPEQFWRICDGNNAMRPEDLLETIGRRLTVPRAEG